MRKRMKGFMAGNNQNSSRLIGFLIIFLILLSIPLTVFLSKQKQDLRKRAQVAQNPPVTVEARFYPDVKTKLMAGDLLTMPAVRQSSDSAMTADHWKFQKAISALNAVNKNEIGVKKGIFLSAVDDVKNLIGSIPLDVDWVIYNMEPGMTPSTDLADPVASVKQFANIVRSSGRKMGFAPTRVMFDQYQGTTIMTDVLNSIDAIGYQGQLLLPAIGEDAFVQTVQQKYAYVKGVNSNVEFRLQLWLLRQTPQEMISAFNKLQNSMDRAVIGAASGLDLTSEVLEVLSGLSWRQQSSPTPTITPTPTPTPFVDISAPTVYITYPLNGAIVAKNKTTSINATATDNVGVIKVEFYINNVLKYIDTVSPYSYSWYVPNKPKVTYALSAKAYDAASNVGSQTITVTSK